MLYLGKGSGSKKQQRLRASKVRLGSSQKIGCKNRLPSPPVIFFYQKDVSKVRLGSSHPSHGQSQGITRVVALSALLIFNTY